MNSINRRVILLALVSVVLFVAAWFSKSFALLGFGVSFLLITAVLRFKKSVSVLVPAISVLIMLSIVEMFVPATPPASDEKTKYDPKSGYVNNYIRKVPGFGYQPRPGVHTSKKLTLDDEVIYDVVYSIGADGYRADVASDFYDTYIYGGSFTFGEGLNDNETISSYLSAHHGIMTKNVGIHGYGLHQALYNIQHGLTFAEPGGVNILLTVPWHALRSACKPSYSFGTPRYALDGDRLYLDGVCGEKSVFFRILERSNIFKLVDRALFNQENLITDEDIDLYLAIIREIARLTKERGGDLLIAYMDASDQRLSTTSWTNERFMAHMDTLADMVIDVTLSKTHETLDPKYTIHPLDQHPSAAANRERARLIAGALKKLKAE